MVAGQHKLSRRAVLGGACAGVCAPSLAAVPAPLPPLSAAEQGAWAAALARWSKAEAEVAGLAHSEDEDAYDAACGRHDRALAAVLSAAAPDAAAAAWKLGLIARHQVFELSCRETAMAVLAEDLRRL